MNAIGQSKISSPWRPTALPWTPLAAPPPFADTVTLSAPVTIAPPPARIATAVLAGMALWGAVGPVIQSQIGTAHQNHIGGWSQQGHMQGSGSWDRRVYTTPDGGHGWEIPRNPSPVPVQPGYAYEVPPRSDDLGTVQVLDNTRGKIHALRLQWPNETDERALGPHEALFREMFTKMDSDVRFEVVAEGGGAEQLRQKIAEWKVPNPGRIEILPLSLYSSPERYYTGMSVWARDNSVTLERASDGREVVLLPHSFRDDGQVDKYLNRVIINGGGEAPAFLAKQHPELLVRRSELDFEGGNVVANGRHVLITSETVEQNARRLKVPEEQVVERFGREFGREVVVVKAPDFHLDMGVNFLDDRTVMVADPRLTDGLQPSAGVSQQDLLTMRSETAAKDLAPKYDAVAKQMAQAGYRVVRLPNLAGRSLSTPYMTYHNVLMERFPDQNGREIKRVYMPTYDLPAADKMAREAYQREGLQVVEMHSALQSTRLSGAVRCAVGELDVR